ncbi:MAG TPA: hypothetical protein VI112_12250 [Bacteroidia bacterium]|jgi:YD repeat-containing protein
MNEDQTELTPSESPADKTIEAEEKVQEVIPRSIKVMAVIRYGNAGMNDVKDMTEEDALKVREVVYDEKGHVMQETEFSEDGEPAEQFIRTYDEKGNIVEMQHFYEGELSERTQYEFNDKGLLAREKLLYADGSMMITDYQYDENDNVIERKVSDDEGNLDSIETSKYEGKQLVENNKYNGSNELVESRKLIYRTDDPEKIKEEITYETGSGIELRTVFLDDETGNITYNKEGKVHSRQKMNFDEKKRVTETLISTFSGNYQYKYTYDEFDNVIEEERLLGGTTFFKAIIRYNEYGALHARSVTEMNSGLFTDVYQYEYFA